MTWQSSGSQRESPRSAAEAPRSFSDTLLLGPHPTPPESETLGTGKALKSSAGDGDMCSGVRRTTKLERARVAPLERPVKISLGVSISGESWIFLFFFGQATACGILVPQPRIEPVTPSMETWRPNHWTSREFLRAGFQKKKRASHRKIRRESNPGRETTQCKF